MVSVLLLSISLVDTSFAIKDHEFLHEWGSFGISEPSAFSYPQFLTVGDDGSIYVSDFGNKRIQKFSSNGEYILEWGNSGKQSGDFYNPSGIAVSADSVFVADRDVNRIQKFSLDGEFISEWGNKGTSDGKFLYPNDLAFHNGTLYVVDTGNQRIQLFSSDGDFISSFGSSGLGPGQFLNVVGIDIDDDGNVYVTDKGNSKIDKFSANGKFLKSFPFHFPNYVFSPEAIAVDPVGDMFVVNSDSGRILHLSQNSTLRISQIDQAGPYPNSFKMITDIAIGANGELLIVDSNSHVIQAFETTFFETPTEQYYVAPQIDYHPARDQTKPEIIAPASLSVEATDYLTDVFIGNATATDKSGIMTIINNAPEAFSIGMTNLIWIAFDNSGHSASDSQIITVKTCGENYSNFNMIKGTPGDDLLQGTDGDDLIFGLEGNDIISGGSGNDCIFGGSGDDIISGGDGNDTIRGNSGYDILQGNSGNDILYSNFVSEPVDGGHGTDRCYISATSQKDTLSDCE